MRYFSVHAVHRVLSFSIVGVLFVALYLFNPSFLKAPKVESATNSLSGFAWSDTVGWFSFNNTSDGSTPVYSVKADTVTGDFSGSAWSENLGWVSFDRTATNNPPSAPFNGGSGAIASLDLTTGKVTGWARALAGCENTPGVPVTSCTGSGAGAASLGWDGWIRLSDDADTNWVNKGISVALTTGQFSGFAWGSDVVGWIDFAPTGGGGVSMQPTKCTYPADPYGVCGATLVCTASGACIPPDGACSTSFDCGGGQTCKNGTCRPPGYCSVPADCASGICDLVTHTCAASNGTGCGDAVCGTGETLLTCPQDCKGKVQQF